jgi:hypothetical protein
LDLTPARDMLVLSLLVCRSILNVCLVKERTSLRTHTFPIHILVGIFINVTRGWDRGIRMRNAFPIRMGSARLNSAVVSLAMSGRKSEIARVKVCPFLPAVS